MLFQDLWELVEKTHNLNQSIDDIINELNLKINLYQTLNNQIEIAQDDQANMKTRLLGEILFVITKISMKENINVYQALKLALEFRKA